jgi:hypothetical protein
MEQVTARLAELPEFLAPLKVAASRYLQYPSRYSPDGTVSIGHRPWVAELNYLFVLYPGVGVDVLTRYSQQFELEVPALYAEFLKSLCGTFCFGMSLFGIPASVLDDSPLLDRSVLQCHNLASAVHRWTREYQIQPGLFYFGSRYYSREENTGYFINENGRLLSIKKQGEVVGEWTNFRDFLAEELQASEKLEVERHPPQWST